MILDDKVASRLARLADASVCDGCLQETVRVVSMATMKSDISFDTANETIAKGNLMQVLFLMAIGLGEHNIESIIRSAGPSKIAYYGITNIGEVKVLLGTSEKHPTTWIISTTGRTFHDLSTARCHPDYAKVAEWKEGI